MLTAPDPVRRRASVEGLLRELNRLPAQRTAAVRVLGLANDPDCSAAALGHVVGRDPALTARLMRMANSAYYGRAGRVASASEAVTVLGFTTVRTLAAAAAAGLAGSDQLVPRDFWSHATHVAVAASLAAPHAGAAAAQAFSLGLLHDLGRFLLHSLDPAALLACGARASVAQRPLCEVEREWYGVDHAEVGRRVLSAWYFPAPFVDALAEHHDDPADATSPLSVTLHAAEALVAITAGDAAAAASPALARAGVDPSHAATLAARVSDQARRLGASLRGV